MAAAKPGFTTFGGTSFCPIEGESYFERDHSLNIGDFLFFPFLKFMIESKKMLNGDLDFSEKEVVLAPGTKEKIMLTRSLYDGNKLVSMRKRWKNETLPNVPRDSEGTRYPKIFLTRHNLFHFHEYASSNR